jgi:hypothetical protein
MATLTKAVTQRTEGAGREAEHTHQPQAHTHDHYHVAHVHVVKRASGTRPVLPASTMRAGRTAADYSRENKQDRSRPPRGRDHLRRCPPSCNRAARLAPRRRRDALAAVRAGGRLLPFSDGPASRSMAADVPIGRQLDAWLVTTIAPAHRVIVAVRRTGVERASGDFDS